MTTVKTSVPDNSLLRHNKSGLQLNFALALFLSVAPSPCCAELINELESAYQTCKNFSLLKCINKHKIVQSLAPVLWLRFCNLNKVFSISISFTLIFCLLYCMFFSHL